MSIKIFKQLTKFRLSLTVLFSAITGYFLATDMVNYISLSLLFLGGFFVTAGANSFNQIIEREYDALMKRTNKRPIPTKQISLNNAIYFSTIISISGFIILNIISFKCFYLGLLSFLFYIYIYTPLKRKTSLAIFFGAVPGAMPCLLGWVAAVDDFSLASGILFAVQFFWQFPHFIAISWIRDHEYKNAQFKMMPGETKGNLAPLIAVFFTILMIITSVIPFFYNIEGFKISQYNLVLILFLGIFFFIKAFNFLKSKKDNAARKMLLFSYIYLPIVQILFILDKLLIQ
tara:strand:+ start:1560 stop:2423 length:864 start_codon:yes stop_codon:yes gene_type:complete